MEVLVFKPEGATPPIELAANIPCPVLDISGNKEQNPSPEDVADLDAALSGANVPHDFHRYDGAGHGFQDFVNPKRCREEQTKDTQAKIRMFLTENSG